ncbi:uncharacterized protein T069G_10893 [Trichoderma breve]|uniref:Uncharacterized protein n=1 Tax=Trichoderma breve TaxID=2034170 RepID=A0A9W9E374_9HYPO|nr:uncharacterized protein T069G_10893 [Trichoderma breve]KAJ4855335.1 hypothetical protein T069G_10893 [Trichoderma breve]
MVKLATSSLAILAAVMSTVTARNCTPSLSYCGAELLDIGNYASEILAALRLAGEPTDALHRKNSLFYCTGGSGGEVLFEAYCGFGCVWGPSGGDSYCRAFE